MKRYIECQGHVGLFIDEGDPIPTMDEIDEADRFTEAIAIGDPRVELAPMDTRPGSRLAFWKDREQL